MERDLWVRNFQRRDPCVMAIWRMLNFSSYRSMHCKNERFFQKFVTTVHCLFLSQTPAKNQPTFLSCFSSLVSQVCRIATLQATFFRPSNYQCMHASSANFTPRPPKQFRGGSCQEERLNPHALYKHNRTVSE